MGATDVSVTLRVYRHVLPSMGRQAATWFEAQLQESPLAAVPEDRTLQLER